MASWSPSQSEPLTVSYMCHRQSSSVMLPSAALMPPCAATVCERVGKSLVTHAVLRPASARPKAARRPAPPAPLGCQRISRHLSSPPLSCSARRSPLLPRHIYPCFTRLDTYTTTASNLGVSIGQIRHAVHSLVVNDGVALVLAKVLRSAYTQGGLWASFPIAARRGCPRRRPRSGGA